MKDENLFLKDLLSDYSSAKKSSNELVYDKDNMTIRQSSPIDDPDRVKHLNPEIATMYSDNHYEKGTVIIAEEIIQNLSEKQNDVDYTGWEKESVYSLLSLKQAEAVIPGTVYCCHNDTIPEVTEIGKKSDRVRVILKPKNSQNNTGTLTPAGATAYILSNNCIWDMVPVQIIPVKEEIHSRSRGIIETDALADKTVLIIGLGSGGSYIAIELAKAGVGNFIIADHDRLELANIVRHTAPLSHVGRYKTHSISDLIHEKNPYAKVTTIQEKLHEGNMEMFREMIKKSNFNVGATDNNESKLFFNRLCVEENKPCIFAAVFRRAYGGQIFIVRPLETPCFQCFLMMLSDEQKEHAISSSEQAERIAYSDRPVPIEPGLSNDIAPISVMAVKLIIQALLKDTETTLRSLDEDLIASWYIYLSRREEGTQYAELEPLKYNIDGMHILHWYGIKVERHPGCPVCGDFEKYILEQKPNSINNHLLNY